MSVDVENWGPSTWSVYCPLTGEHALGDRALGGDIAAPFGRRDGPVEGPRLVRARAAAVDRRELGRADLCCPIEGFIVEAQPAAVN